MSITERLDKILANPDGRHVDVLCGAGISLDSGLPTAAQFLGALFDGLDIDDFVDDGLDGLRAGIKDLCARLPFEAIIECATTYAHDDSVLSMFADADIRPNAAHALLIAFLAEGVIERIATTNFDLLFERAAEVTNRTGLLRRVCVGGRDSAAVDSKVPANLIKLHGSADQLDSMKITLARIAERKSLTLVGEQVLGLLPSRGYRRLVIIGYSCSDHFDVVPAIRGISESDTEVVFVQHEPNEGKWSIQDLSSVSALGANENPLMRFTGHHIAVDATAFLRDWARAARSPFPGQSKRSFPWQGKMQPFVRALRGCRGRFLGSLFFRVSEFSAAERCYRRALVECAIGSERAFILSQLALLAHILGKVQEVGGLLDEALSAARSENNRFVESGLHESRAEIAVKEGRFRDALAEYQASAALRRELRNPILLAKAYQGMGVAYRHLEDADRALEWTDAALEELETQPDFELQSELLCNKGDLLRLRGDFPAAKACVTDAIRLKENTGDRSGLCNAYIALGTILKNAEDQQGAVAAYTAVLGVANGEGLEVLLGKAHFQLAALYAGMDIGKMAEHLKDATDMFRKGADEFGLAKCDSLWAQLALNVRRSLLLKAKALISEADGPEWDMVAAKMASEPRFALKDGDTDRGRGSLEREIEQAQERLERSGEGRQAVSLYLALARHYEDYAGCLLAAAVTQLSKFSPFEADLLVKRFGAK